jgi:HD-like signal output (HDOD) protein
MNMQTGNLDPQALELLRWNLDTLSTRPLDIHPPHEILSLIRNEDELPVLPETGRRLLLLLEEPDADAGDLAEVVELDPLLAAQLIRWSNSAYYALRQPVSSVKEAIARVLGFEQAAGLALGLIAHSPLQTPAAGTVGRDAVIRHSVRCSHLILELRSLLPAEHRPSMGQAQLCGLTQNIGYLLLGHLLPAAFTFLNELLAKNPKIELPVAERFALGVDHGQLGFWLMETWAMPLPVQTAVRHHHNHRYEGPQQTLVLLNCLADLLLRQTGEGLGPVPEESLIASLAERLDLDPQDCINTVNTPPARN